MKKEMILDTPNALSRPYLAMFYYYLVNNFGLKRHDNVLVSALVVFWSKCLEGVSVSDLVALLYLKICTIKTPSKHNVLIVPWYRVLFSSFFILEGGNLYILMGTGSEQYPI